VPGFGPGRTGDHQQAAADAQAPSTSQCSAELGGIQPLRCGRHHETSLGGPATRGQMLGHEPRSWPGTSTKCDPLAQRARLEPGRSQVDGQDPGASSSAPNGRVIQVSPRLQKRGNLRAPRAPRWRLPHGPATAYPDAARNRMSPAPQPSRDRTRAGDRGDWPSPALASSCERRRRASTRRGLPKGCSLPRRPRVGEHTVVRGIISCGRFHEARTRNCRHRKLAGAPVNPVF